MNALFLTHQPGPVRLLGSLALQADTPIVANGPYRRIASARRALNPRLIPKAQGHDGSPRSETARLLSTSPVSSIDSCRSSAYFRL
jgi:hypothetical protein